MNRLAVIFIIVLFFGCVKAAFEDFVIRPESQQQLHSNELDFGCDAEGIELEEQQFSLQDLLENGAADPQVLLSVLMQQAERLGLSLEQLVQLGSMEDSEVYSSQGDCSAAATHQPRWYDVFFD